MRRQYAIRADYFQRIEIAHEQVIAKGVECVDVEAGRARKARAHFVGEHAIAQALRFAQFVLGRAHATCRRCCPVTVSAARGRRRRESCGSGGARLDDESCIGVPRWDS